MQFGKLLKEYIKKQDLTIYQLAKETGIDRSFLQGVLNGTRKLPKKRFSDIVNSNYFTVNQIHKLCEQYFFERFGAEKVQRFEYIEKGMKGKYKDELNISCDITPIEIKKETSFYSGKKEVLAVIYTILNKENTDTFTSNFDFADTEINRIIYAACKNGKIKDFFHYVTFDKTGSIRNIEIIFNALHYGEIGFITHIRSEYSANFIMPYFILTNHYFIMYDDTAENAVLFSTALIDAFLSQKINKIKDECRQFVFVTNDVFEYLNIIDTWTAKSASKVLASIDNQMCPTFITPEIIEAIATSAVKNIPAVTRQLTAHYDLVMGNGTEHNKINQLIDTYQAVSDFVKNGLLAGFPRTLADPVPTEMRSHFLKSLLDKNKVERIIITNPNFFSSDYDFNFQINDNYLFGATSQGLDSLDDYNGKILFFTDYDIIANDFKDYLDYLSMSENTYSPAVSEKIIKSFIEQLDA